MDGSEIRIKVDWPEAPDLSGLQIPAPGTTRRRRFDGEQTFGDYSDYGPAPRYGRTPEMDWTALSDGIREAVQSFSELVASVRRADDQLDQVATEAAQRRDNARQRYHDQATTSKAALEERADLMDAGAEQEFVYDIDVNSNRLPYDMRRDDKARWDTFLGGFRDDMTGRTRHPYDEAYRQLYDEAGGSYRDVLGNLAKVFAVKLGGTIGGVGVGLTQGLSQFHRGMRQASYFRSIGHGNRARIANIAALRGLGVAAIAAFDGVKKLSDGISYLGKSAMATAKQVGMHTPELASTLAQQDVADLLADIQFAQKRGGEMAEVVASVRSAERHMLTNFREFSNSFSELYRLGVNIASGLSTFVDLFTTLMRILNPVLWALNRVLEWALWAIGASANDKHSERFLREMADFASGGRADLPAADAANPGELPGWLGDVQRLGRWFMPFAPRGGQLHVPIADRVP